MDEILRKQVHDVLTEHGTGSPNLFRVSPLEDVFLFYRTKATMIWDRFEYHSVSLSSYYERYKGDYHSPIQLSHAEDDFADALVWFLFVILPRYMENASSLDHVLVFAHEHIVQRGGLEEAPPTFHVTPPRHVEEEEEKTYEAPQTYEDVGDYGYNGDEQAYPTHEGMSHVEDEPPHAMYTTYSSPPQATYSTPPGGGDVYEQEDEDVFNVDRDIFENSQGGEEDVEYERDTPSRLLRELVNKKLHGIRGSTLYKSTLVW
jgi:hypothetical protein